MKIVIAGASGLVGSSLVPFLRNLGHDVKKLVRDKNRLSDDAAFWDPIGGHLDPQLLNGVDAVINLAGVGIRDKWWSEEFKKEIIKTRVDSTNLLVAAMAQTASPPKVLINASAVGFYGERGNEVLTENSAPGTGFLSSVCLAWEGAAEKAKEQGVRVVVLRIGFVLSCKGGGLRMMLAPFKFGLGGKVGSGQQFISWIDLDDLLALTAFVLTHEDIIGAVNAVAPIPVTNMEFTKVLGEVLHRPTFCSMPAVIARLAFKEMADAIMLCSARVIPEKLNRAAFKFAYPQLKSALEHQVGRVQSCGCNK